MRLIRGVALLLVGVVGCADYSGQKYDRVVEARDVEVLDALPKGYFVIGEVESDHTDTIDGTSDLEYELYCEVDDMLLRRMKRAAARNGGEILVGVECSYEDYEDVYTVYDHGWFYEQVELTCPTYCWAEVARHQDRDVGQ